MEPEIRYEYKKVVSWGELVEIFRFSRPEGREDIAWSRELLWEASHSMGGRIVTPQGSASFSEALGDPSFDGIWYGWEEGAVFHVQFTSASSGSRLTATRSTKTGGWDVTLSVPQEDGKPYEGAYWRAFHGQG